MNSTATRRTTGGDVLVEVMRRHGIDTAFGIISVHNLPLVEAVARDLNFVEMRHEAAAVSAADGYARATGGIGVALTSTGTGAGNAAGSLVEALTAGSRVLHITGQVDAEFLSRPRGVIHEFPGQLQMLDACSAHAARVPAASAARRTLEEAIAAILATPSGPASIEWPSDLQYLARPQEQEPWEPGLPAVPHPDPTAISRAAQLLAAAHRPLLWLGGGAAGAAKQVEELAHRLGAAVVTSNSGRAIISEDDPLVIGNFAADPGCAALLRSADLMLSVGTHFRSNETRSYGLELPAQHIQIDVDADALGRVYPCTVGLHGDAAAVLDDLLGSVTDTGTDPDWPAGVTRTREALRAGLREAIGGYAEICSALRTVLPREAVVARDVTIPSSQWGNRLLEFYDRRSNIFPLGGGIGQGLGMAIGASVGRPEVPTVALVGDGGLAVHLGELGSLCQANSWCVVLVFNDSGYGVLRNMQRANGLAELAVDLYTPDFEALAAAYRMPYWKVHGATDVARIVTEAVAVRGPVLVEVDVPAIEPRPKDFTPPVHIPEPRS